MWKNFCWHRWKVIRTQMEDVFLGVTYTRIGDTQFRRCTKCKRVQEFSYDSQGGCWSYLSETELLIFNERFKDENGK